MTEKSLTFPLMMKWFVYVGGTHMNGALHLGAA